MTVKRKQTKAKKKSIRYPSDNRIERHIRLYDLYLDIDYDKNSNRLPLSELQLLYIWVREMNRARTIQARRHSQEIAKLHKEIESLKNIISSKIGEIPITKE